MHDSLKALIALAKANPERAWLDTHHTRYGYEMRIPGTKEPAVRFSCDAPENTQGSARLAAANLQRELLKRGIHYPAKAHLAEPMEGGPPYWKVEVYFPRK